MSVAGGDVPVIIVTPYCREPRAVIERAIASVAAQSHPVRHILVADGHPASWIADYDVDHIILDHAHCDGGNVARSVGLVAAMAMASRAVTLLDADNWYGDDHVARCLAAADAAPGCDYVIARRRFARLDGSIMPLTDEPVTDHVDTSCLFALPPAYALMMLWGQVPPVLWLVGDRLIYAAAQARGLRPAIVDAPSVNYTVHIGALYARIGEEPPPGTRPLIDTAAVARAYAACPPEERALIEARLGIRIRFT